MNEPKYRAQKIMAQINLTRKHEILQICGERELDAFLMQELNRFSTEAVIPIAVRDIDGSIHVVCNYFIVEAAVVSGLQQIEIVVFDCPVSEAPRLFNFAVSFRKTREYGKIYDLILYLCSWRKQTEEGRLFFSSLPGKDTRAKICYLLGFESSQYNRIATIGSYAPHLFVEIQEGLGLRPAYESAIAIRNKREEENASSAVVSVSKRENELPPADRVSLFSSQAKSDISDDPSRAEGNLVQKFNGKNGFVSTSTGVPRFNNAPSVSLPFRPALTSFYMAGIGSLELDLSSDELQVKVNNMPKPGFSYRLRDMKDHKILELIFEGDVAGSFLINPKIFNQ